MREGERLYQDTQQEKGEVLSPDVETPIKLELDSFLKTQLRLNYRCALFLLSLLSFTL